MSKFKIINERLPLKPLKVIQGMFAFRGLFRSLSLFMLGILSNISWLYCTEIIEVQVVRDLHCTRYMFERT